MLITSWNVNGLRACERKGFWDWLQGHQPDVLCLQEVRAEVSQLSDALQTPAGYHVQWNPAQRKGYSGVATWSRHQPECVAAGLGEDAFDNEGRVIVTKHAGVVLYNIYFPNGGNTLERVPFKLSFYDTLMAQLQVRMDRGERIIVAGDFNTAHTPIDLANPQANVRSTGFLPEERAAIDRFLSLGFTDVFRHRHPEQSGHYTWWSNRMGARARNVGWRIDYFLISDNLLPFVDTCRIHPEVQGSDHCPVSLRLKNLDGLA